MENVAEHFFKARLGILHFLIFGGCAAFSDCKKNVIRHDFGCVLNVGFLVQRFTKDDDGRTVYVLNKTGSL